MNKTTDQVSVSVHQRLLNKAKQTERPFNELFQYYAMEKFLHRISLSPYAEEFILKGALLLRATGISEIRPTKDMDFLGPDNSDVIEIKQMLADCCKISVKDDGLKFDPRSITEQEIRENQAYNGVRFKIKGSLGNAIVSIQIDMGFGDVVSPGPYWIEYPAILDDEEKPKLKAYTLESAIAEKFQAMVDLDLANSRMKDFYDIWFLSKNRSFDGEALKQAIQQTFHRRKTELPDEYPTALTTEFSLNEDKVNQWNAFVSKLPESSTTSGLNDTIKQIQIFLWPVSQAALNQQLFNRKWNTEGQWQSSSS
ncbi:nucleotidyl transferase AbiEii/AbiGii toxin family protein [Rhodohalobacter sp. SW132]|uniref:nucleotidyl transferase AbiEii/AbiGii toxin family protein n=1 Tax=Rhodohalobacter sp. SW132 TaxID=2293433 RepID=UPI000E2279F0|nr:nucleotidyl transferase AbiEii/AbiGii toxin family protein [Rhodohalobacter sp. SW132]REL24830.1 nucleotidyl transferase AbiEii/AbiGii toxin family protein [Rhodohalobacter sp. SW132]